MVSFFNFWPRHPADSEFARNEAATMGGGGGVCVTVKGGGGVGGFYTYMYVCMYVCIYIYIYLFIIPTYKVSRPRPPARARTGLGWHYLSNATCLMWP